MMASPAPFFLFLVLSLIHFSSIATSLSDISLLTPTDARLVTFSVHTEHPATAQGKRIPLSEMARKNYRVNLSTNPITRKISSSKVLVRTGLLKETQQQKIMIVQRAASQSAFSQQIHHSGDSVETLLRRLALRPVYHDRYLRTRQIALNTLMEQLGKPYRWGGASPFSGFDCSGLIYFAYKDHIKHPFPRTAKGMFYLQNAAIISPDKLEPGDLVFFQIRQNDVDHVGVYLGNNQFIQSPRTGLDIRISKLSDNYWQNHYVGARRVMTPDNIYE